MAVPLAAIQDVLFATSRKILDRLALLIERDGRTRFSGTQENVPRQNVLLQYRTRCPLPSETENCLALLSERGRHTRSSGVLETHRLQQVNVVLEIVVRWSKYRTRCPLVENENVYRVLVSGTGAPGFRVRMKRSVTKRLRLGRSHKRLSQNRTHPHLSQLRAGSQY